MRDSDTAAPLHDDSATPSSSASSPAPMTLDDTQLSRRRSDMGAYSRSISSVPVSAHFTFRSLVTGLLIGVLINFSNTYFGLQTGWVSSMAMPASLIGFAVFKALRSCQIPGFCGTRPYKLGEGFGEVENVLVQTVAGAVGTMPLGCGFVGVIPALEFLLKRDEGGPLNLGYWKLLIWSLGVCLFGVVFAVPLRKEVIVREKLKFPSGTATALMIGVLHGDSEGVTKEVEREERPSGEQQEETEELLGEQGEGDEIEPEGEGSGLRDVAEDASKGNLDDDRREDWKANIKLLTWAFTGSAVYVREHSPFMKCHRLRPLLMTLYQTLMTHFIPQLRNVPIFGLHLANTWLWTLNPSPAYAGQGIIMGPATTLHMLLGAVLGWGVLSPIAKFQGWAPASVDDWDRGSKGWIVWISLAIMLADSLINLGWLILKPVIQHAPQWRQEVPQKVHQMFSKEAWRDALRLHINYSPLRNDPSSPLTSHQSSRDADRKGSGSKGSVAADDDDAPPEHLIKGKTIAILLPLTIIFCVVCIHFSFGAFISPGLNVFAILLALVLSVMGVRALGETDLNPVSGISKLTQLVFALVTPHDDKNAIVINLVAGAVSESGALQAGDLMQDLKTGHLLNASPKAQFYGQIIGSILGAAISAAVYRLYVTAYEVPGSMFQVPTAYVWIFTARLVTGRGLPEMAWQFAVGTGVFFALTTILKIWLGSGSDSRRKWQPYVPGGIAVAVGMYNTPSFTLARTIGGLVNWYWVRYRRREETPVIVLASGLILGEGVVSIINLGLATLRVPHL